LLDYYLALLLRFLLRFGGSWSGQGLVNAVLHIFDFLDMLLTLLLYLVQLLFELLLALLERLAVFIIFLDLLDQRFLQG